MKVLISNGFNKFHLAVAASHMAKRGYLEEFITGAYPGVLPRWLATHTPVGRSAKFQQFIQRVEKIPDSKVCSLWIPESYHVLARSVTQTRSRGKLSRKLIRYAMKSYGQYAVDAVRRAANSGAKIYHYRAGFGHESVKVAKDLGMYTLCDHSIAHPAVLQYMVENNGLFPMDTTIRPSGVWSDVLDDIEQGDSILCNSDFVKETFVHLGWDKEKIHVIYLGIDDQFLHAIPDRDKNKLRVNGQRIEILFAGGFEKRKGAETIVNALENLHSSNWRLRIAGQISPSIRAKYRRFFSNKMIEQLGWISRYELARKMSSADIFIFPSLVEGSARVIFEAMACGCYVITTKNSGSIVEKGEHGDVVVPGDPKALCIALECAIADPENLMNIGNTNAKVVRKSYSQNTYGEKLERLYSVLL